MAQCQRCRVSGATGANALARVPHECFYFPLETRPLIVFVDGWVHLGKSQMLKDEELRSLLRKRGYRILELSYISYSDKKRNELYEEIRNSLSKIAY